MVRIGDALGLYRALHAKGSMTCAELAKEVGVNERYLREWLSHQAASNYLHYEPASGKFTLPPEQAMVFADEDSPVYMLGGFDLMASLIDAQPKVQAAFKTGGGVGWDDHTGCMFCAVARFFRPGYYNNLVANWLPALDGVVGKLQRGATVADVGCGHGWSTVLMAKAVPEHDVRRLRLPSEFDRECAAARTGARRAGQHTFRSGEGQGVSRHRFRSGDVLRLPP